MERTVIDILEELESTSGGNAKRAILEAARGNDLLKRVFVGAQDPYTVYYVNKFKIPAPGSARPGGSDVVVERFIAHVLPRLSAREVTGNEAKALVEHEFGKMTRLEQKWMQRVLIHNLRCGVQESTVNKVWPGTLMGFKVALAATLKSEFVRGEGIRLMESVSYPIRVEPKLDGLRCIAVKRAGEVTLYTRNGTVLETLPRIKQSLQTAAYDDVVLDGEAMGEDWNESASVLMSSKTRKDDSRIVYNVFDAIPVDDWIAQETQLTLAQRCLLAHEAVLATLDFEGRPCVRQVPHAIVNNEEELRDYFSRCMDEGHEGVMLKAPGAVYEWDRSRSIMKLKPCATFEGTVVSWYEGRRGTKREGQFGGFEVLLPNGITTSVGGGFSDVLRAQIQLEDPSSWIGRIVECEAQPDPATKDGLTVAGKMRFPVFIRERSPADVDPAIVAAYDAWKAR